VKYYCEQADSQDRSLREAACHCISELATKVATLGDEIKLKIQPHVEALLKSVCKCFKDEVWSVRDAASAASGYLVA
jgi:hypothetical protein